MIIREDIINHLDQLKEGFFLTSTNKGFVFSFR